MENKQVNNEERLGYKQELKRTLGFKSILIFAFGYISPTTVMTYYGLVSMSTHGMLAFSFIVASVAMAFTAFSYAKMVRVYPIAGSSYSYTTKSINSHVGFLTGWVILLDYVLLPIVCLVLCGLYCNILIPTIPGWVFVIIVGVFIAFISCRGINVVASLNNVLVIIMLVVMVAILLFMIKFIATGNGAATLFSPLAIINPEELDEVGIGSIFAGASILVLCFLGIDAATTLAEEAIEPEKNVGRAIITVTIGVGLYFVIFSYIMQLAWPTGWMEFENADTASTEIVELTCGSVLAYIYTAVYVVSCFVCVLTVSTSATRILYSMGRDGVIPRSFFGYVHPKFKTPMKNIILVLALAVVLGCLVDLMSISSVVNFGALVAFTMVNVSVIAHYFVREKRRNSLYEILSYLIAPLIGSAVCIVVFFSLDSTALTIGGIWFVIGFIYLAIMTKGFKKKPIEMEFAEVEIDK